jgi:hypothetical protein
LRYQPGKDIEKQGVKLREAFKSYQVIPFIESFFFFFVPTIIFLAQSIGIERYCNLQVAKAGGVTLYSQA